MEIVITGRRTDVPERFRQQAEEKLVKVTQFASRAQRVDVELSHERNPRQANICKKVEITVRGKGPVVRAEACAEEPCAALDIAFGKLLERLRRMGDRRKVHHGRHAPASVRMPNGLAPEAGVLTPASGIRLVNDEPAGSAGSADAEDPAGETAADNPLASLAEGEVADGPMVIRTKDHQAMPMTLDQALYEMELVGHDFFLFVDATTQRPCVVYRRHGYHYGVIRLEVMDPAVAAEQAQAMIAAGAG